ncbi:hypothetical protein Avbf_18263 [Armadillidium vulgare]|nr:hypothetical protein Avbf_18263 [Armadillidium vulgare]
MKTTSIPPTYDRGNIAIEMADMQTAFYALIVLRSLNHITNTQISPRQNYELCTKCQLLASVSCQKLFKTRRVAKQEFYEESNNENMNIITFKIVMQISDT